MAEKRIKRPRDPIQRAKLIGDIATGQVEDRVEDGKDPTAVEFARRRGKKRRKGARGQADAGAAERDRSTSGTRTLEKQIVTIIQGICFT